MADLDNHPRVAEIVSLVRQARGAADEAELHSVLSVLLDDVFLGGGASGPDDGAIDQLATVVDALAGDEGDRQFLRDEWRTENQGDVTQMSWLRFLKSYALDDLPE